MQDGAGENLSKKQEMQMISPLTSEIVEHADLAESRVLDKAETLMEMSDEKMTVRIFEIYRQTALEEKESEQADLL